MAQIVVVGAGQAGSSLVSKLRNSGFEGKVTLIGAEPHPPYQRRKPRISFAIFTSRMVSTFAKALVLSGFLATER